MRRSSHKASKVAFSLLRVAKFCLTSSEALWFFSTSFSPDSRQVLKLSSRASISPLCSWWRSSKASAPATSLASSSAEMIARMSLIQEMRSLKSERKREDNILLCNPSNRLISIPIETLNLVGSKKFLLAGESQLPQALPGFIQFLLTLGDYLHLWVSLSHQLFCQSINFRHAVFLGCHVLLEFIKLPLKHFHMLQIYTKLFRSDIGLLVIDPVHDLITLPLELNQNQCLLQAHALVCQAAKQQFPQPLLTDDIRGKMLFVDHLRASVVQHHNSIRMGSHLCLKGLVLLNLGLKVGGIFVALIRSCLELLMNPGLQLVSITLEILQKHITQ
ncbi:hypothetical protein E2C01_045557 [Portunus trituberculatus]|uniref:Uncharacterized protein n=1 Tax=Portunus trituberculatus TaxID=210409 RepID=A0A5B7G2T0_PORTR|nr:hypothetical protein [Portunus trituberculatus]